MKKKKKIWSVFGCIFWYTQFLPLFLRRNDQKKDQNRTKNKISPSFFSHRPVGFCARCFFDERNFANLFRLLFFEHTNAGRKDVLATGARRMLRRQSAHRCTPGTFRRSMRAFDGVERAVFGDECAETRRCECCAFLVRFLVAFFLLPLKKTKPFWARETKKKNRNPVGKRPARKRRERTFLTVVFFGAAVFFFVAAAALICKANAIFVFDIRGVNAKACEI